MRRGHKVNNNVRLHDLRYGLLVTKCGRNNETELVNRHGPHKYQLPALTPFLRPRIRLASIFRIKIARCTCRAVGVFVTLVIAEFVLQNYSVDGHEPAINLCLLLLLFV